MSHAVFEVSWEVANKVGGIHTVVASRAPTMVARHGDDYVAIGPLLGDDRTRRVPFEEEPGFEEVREACREAGVEARVGRWLIAGRPRTILVGFSGLFALKDTILAGLWERYGVDSLFGGWDYVEPVLFAHAAGIALDRWWHEVVAPRRLPAVALFHEWMSGAGMLYLKEHLPAVGTVFLTHATVLGRALASAGRVPVLGLDGKTPEEVAKEQGVSSKHSMEGSAARAADVFSTVSRITAEEARLFHRREPVPLLPNGLDLDVIDQLASAAPFDDVRARLRQVAYAVTGEDAKDAFYVCISGRYEVHNKGIDLLLQALARLDGAAGRPIVAFLLVPSSTTGLKRDVKDRVQDPGLEPAAPLGLSTHDLVDADRDPVQALARELGLRNETGRRVKIVQVPVYLDGHDGLLDLPYETVLKAMDLGAYPSFYEPWGYTPAECIAVGVPTVTTDCAGFGGWAAQEGLGEDAGVHVLARYERSDADAAKDLADVIERRTESAPDREKIAAACRRTARQLAWSDLVLFYQDAFDHALDLARDRGAREPLVPQRRRVSLTPQPLAESPRPRLVPFRVEARLPAALADLDRLARNLWWTWDVDARALFRGIDPELWTRTQANPLALLDRVLPERLEALAADAAFCARLAAVVGRFDAYVSSARAEVDLGEGAVLDRKRPVAYFSFEYALHPSLHGYAGGLGVLAGDHLKSASDLDLPLVAVGLLYRGGYGEQEISPHGEALTRASHDDPRELPLRRVRGADGEPLQVEVGLLDRQVVLFAWRADVGRVPLYLLDADQPDNRPADRELTRRLYSGDREHRLLQEILLGKGGIRLLGRLGLDPAVLHLNEGHAGFAPLERVAHLVHEENLAPDEAWAVVRATTAFTTHTPVPAGHDTFDEDLVRRHFGDTPAWTGLSWERFLASGRAPGQGGPFNMTYLAMSFASWINGVSRRHGEVSRRLLHPFWPGLLENELPVESITNGIHLPTWTSPEIASLLGAEGRAVTAADFAGAPGLPDEAVWTARCRARERMLDGLGQRLEAAALARGEARKIAREREGLRSDALYLVFARRFSPYKRPTLLLGDPDRLARLLGDEDRPVRLVFAGKAHPDDGLGQGLVRAVVAATRDPRLRGRVFFVPNYDLSLARLLVQGADVWLNHPIPPLEASGTSGMKVAANGGLNLSVLDGWWVEGHDGMNGWALDGVAEAADRASADEIEASAIFSLLEAEVVPSFFDREGRVPRRWVERVKHALATIPPVFDTDRMVSEYARRAYGPLAANHARLSSRRYAAARALAAEHRRLRDAMDEVRIAATRIGNLEGVGVGDYVDAEVDLSLNGLRPTDVSVELVLARSSESEETDHLQSLTVRRLDARGPGANGVHRYEGRLRLERPGPYRWGLRVRPRETTGLDLTLHRLVRWA